MDDIIVLNIKYKFGDMEDFIHPVVLKDDNEMILVDCGYSGFMPAIETAMQEEGLDCNELTKILITHHDHDHMGALADFKQKYPNIEIVAGQIEAPYISGDKKALRLEQAEALLVDAEGEQKAFGEAFCQILQSVNPARVDIPVHGGECFDWCGGCEVLDTPGHTQGHISLYLRSKSTIIAGDAAVLENGRLVIANPQFALDKEKADEAVDMLLKHEARTIICYHGGIHNRTE